MKGTKIGKEGEKLASSSEGMLWFMKANLAISPNLFFMLNFLQGNPFSVFLQQIMQKCTNAKICEQKHYFSHNIAYFCKQVMAMQSRNVQQHQMIK